MKIFSTSNYVLFLVLFVLRTITYAQENYVPGLIVDLKGDTIDGFINNERWLNNPSTVRFKDKNGIVKEFGPDEVRSFLADKNVFFVSQEVNYDTTSNKVGLLSTSTLPLYKEDKFFLKVHVFGDLALLSLTMNDRLHIFLSKNNQAPIELIYHRFLYRGGILENKGFVTQLSQYFKDCTQITVSESLSYSVDAIRNLIIRYNECKNIKSTIYNTKERTLLKTGLIGSLAYDQYKPSFESGFGYGFGGFVRLYFPDKNYRLSLHTELAYRKTADQKSTETTEFYKIQSIQWSTLINYACFPRYRNILFGAGVSYSGGLPDEYGFGKGKIQSDKALPFICILGDVSMVVKNNLLLGLRYESGDSIDMDYGFGNGKTNRSSSYRFSLGWQF